MCGGRGSGCVVVGVVGVCSHTFIVFRFYN